DVVAPHLWRSRQKSRVALIGRVDCWIWVSASFMSLPFLGAQGIKHRRGVESCKEDRAAVARRKRLLTDGKTGN
ncbi:hypothetical protein, partial [Pseudomonas sp. EYE_354]|uniref:hypothetical protein n=1 Tax=Pseudomonas sp. EYE_354 TaxID=2853449 RepID=UPI002003AD9D